MSTLNDLKVAGNCCIAHLKAIKDSTDPIVLVCWYPDNKCPEKSFCLKLTRLYERELNKWERERVKADIKCE